jgi:outer membrane receptor protein involved in Fe transport
MKKTTFANTAVPFSLKKLAALTACGYALTTLASAPVFAQAADDNIEEIIVTAAKRDQSLVDFSGSVTVVETGAPHLTLNDIAREVPGFFVVDAGARNPAGLVMRGLRMDGVGANDLGGDGYAVASYVDNIPLQGYFAPSAFSLKDLQQVEVIRGPQGTLYGNASIGGLIRYTTAKPDLTKSSVSVTGVVSQTDNSSGLNYDTDLVVNAPLIENTLGVRLLLGKTHNNGFIDNPYLLSGAKKDINDDELSVARLSVLWQPTDEFSLSASQHVQQVDVEDRQASNREFTGDDYTASSRYLQPMDGDLRLSSVDASYKFPGATLTASVNRYDYDAQTLADQTDYLITIDEIYYGFGFYSTYEDFSAYTAADVSVLKDSAELRLVSDDDQRLRWLVGAFYSTDELAATNADVTPGFSDAIGLSRTNDIDLIAAQAEELRELSFYTEIAYDITPAWEVVLGARSFRYDDDLAVCYIFATYMDDEEFYPADCFADSDKHNDVLGKFSTKFKINDTQSIYFTVAEGFRRGGANALPAEYADYRSYEPDTVVNYELGTHGYFFNEQVRVSGALFYIDWEDIQILTAFGADGGIANAESARSQGLELETHINLSEGWALRAGFAFTDAELTENVTSIIGGAENAYSGDRLPGSPRYQYSLGVDYSHSFDRATLDAGLSLSRASEVYTELNDEFMDYDRLNGYTIANAQASVSWRNWRVGAFVHNIANTRGVTGKRTDNLFREQGQFEYVTRPRTVGMSVSYTY